MITAQEELSHLRAIERKLTEALQYSQYAERSMGVPPLIEAALSETRKDIDALRNVVCEEDETNETGAR